jgi:hypothetical protein
LRRREDSLTRLRSVVLRRADEVGERIPVTASGVSPGVVMWSDATTTNHWRDLDNNRRLTGGRDAIGDLVCPRSAATWAAGPKLTYGYGWSTTRNRAS